jgi:hypothetical protein
LRGLQVEFQKEISKLRYALLIFQIKMTASIEHKIPSYERTLFNRAWKTPRTLEELIEQTPHDFRLAPLHFLFTAARIKERAEAQTRILFPNETESHPIRQSFRRAIEDVLSTEFSEIKEQMRLFRVPKNSRRRRDVPRKRTAYSIFCEELRTKRPASEINGKVQHLWHALSAEQKKAYENYDNNSTERRTVAYKRPGKPIEVSDDDLTESEIEMQSD